MKASELIGELQKIIKKHGDCEIELEHHRYATKKSMAWGEGFSLNEVFYSEYEIDDEDDERHGEIEKLICLTNFDWDEAIRTDGLYNEKREALLSRNVTSLDNLSDSEKETLDSYLSGNPIFKPFDLI